MLIDKKSGEIFLYEPIGADFFGEGITADHVVRALDELGGKRAIVRINSPGGSVFDGVAIYNALRRYPGGVDTVVDSIAASIASVIALAGDSRTTARGAMWMIHRAMTFAIGNTSDVRKVLGMLEAADNSLIDIYAERTKGDRKIIENVMEAETWYTAEQSLAFGLSTNVGGDQRGEPAVAAWFKNTPKNLSATNKVIVPKYRHVSALK